MLRENNQAAGSTWVYTYNQGGNLLTKRRYAYTVDTVGTALESISYTYGDANWKDKLTKYAGKTITYDAIGNPLTYAGYQYTWQAGRQLEAITGNGITVQYMYNESGLRIKKVVNGAETAYTLNGKHVVHLKKGDAQLHFYYDAQGRPSHLVSGGYANVPEVKYVYVYNLQGDVIALLNTKGETVVAYTYDAWGNPLSISGAEAEGIGRENPFRYRGYVWDEEIGLYYLRSRDYNPEWGRFLNADSILTRNLFTYCENNPVNKIDSTGMEAIWTQQELARFIKDNGLILEPRMEIIFPSGRSMFAELTSVSPDYHLDIFPYDHTLEPDSSFTVNMFMAECADQGVVFKAEGDLLGARMVLTFTFKDKNKKGVKLKLSMLVALNTFLHNQSTGASFNASKGSHFEGFLIDSTKNR